MDFHWSKGIRAGEIARITKIFRGKPNSLENRRYFDAQKVKRNVDSLANRKRRYNCVLQEVHAQDNGTRPPNWHIYTYSNIFSYPQSGIWSTARQHLPARLWCVSFTFSLTLFLLFPTFPFSPPSPSLCPLIRFSLSFAPSRFRPRLDKPSFPSCARYS